MLLAVLAIVQLLVPGRATAADQTICCADASPQTVAPGGTVTVTYDAGWAYPGISGTWSFGDANVPGPVQSGPIGTKGTFTVNVPRGTLGITHVVRLTWPATADRPDTYRAQGYFAVNAWPAPGFPAPTVTPLQTGVADGDPIPFELTDQNQAADDRVAICCHPTTGSFFGSIRAPADATRSQLVVPVGTPPGDYQLFIVTAKWGQKSGSDTPRFTVEPNQPTKVDVSPAAVPPGKELLLVWSGIPNAVAHDRIGLFREPVGMFENAPFVSISTNGAPSGRSSLTAPRTEGRYHAAIYRGSQRPVLAYSPRAVRVASASVTASPSRVYGGQVFEGAWNDVEGAASGDTLQLASPSAGIVSLANATPVGRDGKVQMTVAARAAPGTYTLRYVDRTGKVLVSSKPVEVYSAGTLTITPRMVVGGTVASVNWDKIATPQDTDRIRVLDEATHKLVATLRPSAVKGSAPIPTLPAGSYEAKYVTAHGVVLAVSNSLYVDAAVGIGIPAFDVLAGRTLMATLHWKDPGPLQPYRMQLQHRATTSATPGAWTVLGELSYGKETYPVTPRTPGQVRVRIVNSGGLGLGITPWITVDSAVKIALPANVLAGDAVRKATFTWAGPPNPDMLQYRLQSSFRGGAWTFVRTLDAQPATYEFKVGTPGQLVLRVVNRDDLVLGASNVLFAEAGVRITLPASVARKTTATATFTYACSTCATKLPYAVQIQRDGGAWTTVASLSSRQASVKFATGAPGTVRMRILNASGLGLGVSGIMQVT